MEFNRPPRLRAVPRVRRVDLPQPPSPPSGQSGSMMGMLVVPLIASTATSGVFILFALTAGGAQQTLMLIAAVVMVAGTGLPVAWMYFEDRGRVKRERRLQLTEYRRRLRNRESDLLQLRAEEQAIREEHDPDAATLLERARARHRQLLERRPTDDDFLALRLGLGLARSDVEVSFPGETSNAPPGVGGRRPPRRRRPRQPHLPSLSYWPSHQPPRRRPGRRRPGGPPAGRRPSPSSRTCPSWPGCARPWPSASPETPGAPPPWPGPCCARPPCTTARTRWWWSASSPGTSLADWSWLKWLPHTRPQRASESALTLLAWDEEGRERLARWLLNELANRRRAVTEASSVEQAPSFPWLLVFTDDFPAVRAEAAFQLALNEGARLNVALLGLAPTLGALPRGCGAVTAFESRPGGLPGGLLTYTDTGARPSPIQCVADAVDAQTAEAIARALAGVTVVQDAGRSAGDLPERVSFFDALGIPTMESDDVPARWADASTETLLQIPLGQVAEGKLLHLDFKEQALGGQGPHGLVAGTTGAGKSELLLTIIAGLALRHPPDVLNFVLIDYKGGDAFRAVVDLPHTVALITDLDEHLASRALVFLTSELKQRERRIGDLKAEGVTSVAEYQAHRGQRPMPLLVIVVDEFARLKAELPEFVRGPGGRGPRRAQPGRAPHPGHPDPLRERGRRDQEEQQLRDLPPRARSVGQPGRDRRAGRLPAPRLPPRPGLLPGRPGAGAALPDRPRGGPLPPPGRGRAGRPGPLPPRPAGPPAGPGETGAYLLPDDERGLATEVEVLVRHLGGVAAGWGAGGGELSQRAGLGVQARRWPEPLPDEVTLLPGPGTLPAPPGRPADGASSLARRTPLTAPGPGPRCPRKGGWWGPSAWWTSPSTSASAPSCWTPPVTPSSTAGPARARAPSCAPWPPPWP